MGNINGLLVPAPLERGAARLGHASQDGVEQDRGGAADAVLLTVLTPVYEPSKISLDSSAGDCLRVHYTIDWSKKAKLPHSTTL